MKSKTIPRICIESRLYHEWTSATTNLFVIKGLTLTSSTDQGGVSSGTHSGVGGSQGTRGPDLVSEAGPPLEATRLPKSWLCADYCRSTTSSSLISLTRSIVTEPWPIRASASAKDAPGSSPVTLVEVPICAQTSTVWTPENSTP